MNAEKRTIVRHQIAAAGMALANGLWATYLASDYEATGNIVSKVGEAMAWGCFGIGVAVIVALAVRYPKYDNEESKQ